MRQHLQNKHHHHYTKRKTEESFTCRVLPEIIGQLIVLSPQLQQLSLRAHTHTHTRTHHVIITAARFVYCCN